MKIRTLVILLLLAPQSATFGQFVHGPTQRKAEGKEKEEVLYVWAGDQARQAPDFLAVIDFNEESQNYGRVLTSRTIAT